MLAALGPLPASARVTGSDRSKGRDLLGLPPADSIQAMEAIKLLLGLGDRPVGRLLAYDALEESFRTSKINRDPACPACGPDAGEIVSPSTTSCACRIRTSGASGRP